MRKYFSVTVATAIISFMAMALIIGGSDGE